MSFKKSVGIGFYIFACIGSAHALNLNTTNMSCDLNSRSSIMGDTVTQDNLTCSVKNDPLASELNVNILAISLAGKKVHLEPVWDNNILHPLDKLADANSTAKNLLAGVNGGFFNMVTDPNFKDDICYSSMLQPNENKGDSFLQINGEEWSQNCKPRAIVMFNADNSMTFIKRGITNVESKYGIGAGPMLVENGAIIDVTQADDNNPTKNDNSSGFPWIMSHAPRTVVGYNPLSKTAFLVTIDGVKNKQDRSKDTGLTVPQVAEFMKENVEVNEATNLDGGGSTSMWISGKSIINNPSEGTPRPIYSGLFVVEGDYQ